MKATSKGISAPWGDPAGASHVGLAVPLGWRAGLLVSRSKTLSPPTFEPPNNG